MVDTVNVASADLSGKLDHFGQLQFLRVEWWDQTPRFALLRYAMNGHEEPNGLRLDLDKKVILDSVSNTFLDDAIRRRASEIWDVVVEEQKIAAGGGVERSP
jgi:hypothetical protein